ncbi:MAG TPA: response regulator transcription factor [Ktedonobacteraceae bacterium]|nr:response regulator transcription factor [Ktedonobacteraceae bacterium]
MAQKILIIEDEEGIVHLLNLYLKDAGYDVVVARDGADGLALHAREHPDLVILDIMLPAIDGFEVCRRIRAWSKTPILMLTARGSEDDRISGLDLGADDYLVKPFSPRELVSRVRAILRRVGSSGLLEGKDAVGTVSPLSKVSSDTAVLRFPGLTIDLPARRVEINGAEIALTPTEFDLLALLAQSPGRVFTREILMNKVWGYDYLGDGHTIDVHISALRKKLESNAEQRYITTVWRVGYRFEIKARSVVNER